MPPESVSIRTSLDRQPGRGYYAAPAARIDAAASP
jgi:hypothetical protein